MSGQQHIALWPGRLWLNISRESGRFLCVGLQHRIAPPPADVQTCHHSVLISIERQRS